MKDIGKDCTREVLSKALIRNGAEVSRNHYARREVYQFAPGANSPL